MKNKGLIYILIIFFSILVIVLTVSLIFLLKGDVRFGHFNLFTQESNKLIKEEKYTEIFDDISIDVSAGNIYIKNTNSDNIEVKVYGNDEQLEYDDTDGLKIKYRETHCIGFCFGKSSRIEIMLPSNYVGNIDINNNYGDIEIDKFTNASIKVESDYGDTNIEEAKILDIESNCGDVSIGVVSNVSIRSDLGSIHIDKVTSYLDVKNDCGDIKIKEIDINKDSQIENNLGSIKVNKTNDIYIDAKNDLGSTDVNNSNREAEVKLSVINDCGSIKIN